MMLPFYLELALLVTLGALGDTLEALIDRFRSPNAPAHERALLASDIAVIGSEEAVAFLQERLEVDKEREVRRALLSGILQHPESLERRFVRQSTLDEDPFFRAHCLIALEALAPSLAVKRAREVLLYDEDERVRASSIKVLGRRLDAEIASFLITQAAERRLEEQREVVRVLARAADESLDTLLERGAPFWEEAAEDPQQRLLATLVLAARARKPTMTLLTKLAKDSDRRVAAAAALGLDRVRDRGSGAAMKRALERARGTDERWAILDVVGRIGLEDKGLTKLLTKELKGLDWKLRAAAAEALAGVAPSRCVAPIRKLLTREKVWQVKVACVRALAQSRRPEAVTPLIDLLEESRGRIYAETARALAWLTGMSFGGSVTSWRQWWNDHHEGYEPPSAEVAMWADYEVASKDYAFYGLEVFSQSVVFALDVSGSMRGGPVGKLRKELVSVIEGVPEECLFNMIFFSTGVQAWSEKMLEMSKRNKTKALEAVRYLNANGGTNMWQGLLTSLKDERVDTVFLLSDGQPTVGEHTSVDTICKKILSLNRHRRIAFHVVMIGFRSEALKRLAVESGGRYVVL